MLYFGMRAIKLHSVKRTCRYEVLLVVTGASQCCQPSESRADCVLGALGKGAFPPSSHSVARVSWGRGPEPADSRPVTEAGGLPCRPVSPVIPSPAVSRGCRSSQHQASHLTACNGFTGWGHQPSSSPVPQAAWVSFHPSVKTPHTSHESTQVFYLEEIPKGDQITGEGTEAQKGSGCPLVSQLAGVRIPLMIHLRFSLYVKKKIFF